MRIDSAGRVGIGTASPGEILEIRKDSPDPFNTVQTHLKLTNGGGNSGAGNRIVFATGSTQALIQAKISGGNSNSGSDLEFYTHSTTGTPTSPRLIIDSSGRLLVGTTTAPNSETFAVSGTAAIEGLNGSTVVTVSQNAAATVTYTLRSKESGMMIVTYSPSSTQTDWGASGGDGLYRSVYFGNLANARANVFFHDAGRGSTTRDGAISITSSGANIIVSKTAGSAGNAGDLSIAIISAHQIRQPVVT
jgi:hypothetical protein